MEYCIGWLAQRHRLAPAVKVKVPQRNTSGPFLVSHPRPAARGVFPQFNEQARTTQHDMQECSTFAANLWNQVLSIFWAVCQLNINRELKEEVPSVATEQQKMYQHQPNQCLIRPLFHSSEKAGLKPLHGLNEINGLHWVKIC